MLWEHRGKDGSGSDTWVGTTVGVAFLITKHPQVGIRIYRLLDRELVSVGFKSVEDAKKYMDRRFA